MDNLYFKQTSGGVRCGKNKLNRKKLKVLHTAGSKAFRKVQYDETHFSEKKEAWVHANAKIRHYKLESGKRKLLKMDLVRYPMSNFLLRYLDKKLATYEA
ncbi:hypothetical protein CsSME_00019764 [Camellia sinensis var. sinensis]